MARGCHYDVAPVDQRLALPRDRGVRRNALSIATLAGGAQCVDTATNLAHCGGCDRACGSGRSGGVCFEVIAVSSARRARGLTPWIEAGPSP